MDEEARDRELEKEGYARRFVACEPRLSEAVETYRETGLEVRLESIPLVAGTQNCRLEDPPSEKCRECFRGFEDQYKIIYTRPGKSTGLEDAVF